MTSQSDCGITGIHLPKINAQNLNFLINTLALELLRWEFWKDRGLETLSEDLKISSCIRHPDLNVWYMYICPFRY